jgi:hypothetical protein
VQLLTLQICAHLLPFLPAILFRSRDVNARTKSALVADNTQSLQTRFNPNIRETLHFFAVVMGLRVRQGKAIFRPDHPLSPTSLLFGHLGRLTAG